AAFLVDQHRGIGPSDRLAQPGDQGADLVGILHVAGEQDEAERIGGAEEIALLRRQRGSGAAEDDGSGHRRRRSIKAAPAGIAASALSALRIPSWPSARRSAGRPGRGSRFPWCRGRPAARSASGDREYRGTAAAAWPTPTWRDRSTSSPRAGRGSPWLAWQPPRRR